MFAEVEFIKRQLDNSLTGFLVGLVILHAYISGSLLPGLDVIALITGGFLSIFFPWVMIWKEGVSVRKFIELVKFSLLCILLALVIIYIRPEVLFKAMDIFIWLPYTTFFYFTGLLIFLAIGASILMIVIGLKTMLSTQR
ncbi:MAG: hypothetical protein MNSN_03650 [Minisyncoccus archaeiphilus]|jgi:hypothetical protein|uniref:hypothetical protein n=1 Tax=Minisyncoccus archaeiphilus TaxID=3238481 RepID=UPI002B1A53D2|nr:MAG: hypothetical protein MNSN_03650 [Candidatus Parcubacteria bacterium]